MPLQYPFAVSSLGSVFSTGLFFAGRFSAIFLAGMMAMAGPWGDSIHAQSPATSGQAGPRESQNEVARAAERGLSYLRDSGESWIRKRGCVSCHQIPSLIWSHRIAGQAGIPVPQADLRRWIDWSTRVVNFVKPEKKKDVDIGAAMTANIDTMVALLLATDSQDPDAKWRNPFLIHLRLAQADDGSWAACGQLPMQKRSEIETTATTTLWTTLALLRSDAEFDRAMAIRFADQVTEPESTEWLAVRMMVADSLDDPGMATFCKRLIDCQNEDGGWGWRLDEPSDALGTGYALYAIATVDQKSTTSLRATDSIERARQYLVGSQAESGKWKVPGTKKSAGGKATATANDWGTAWAVVAMIQSDGTDSIGPE